jgi:hypothetical protein
VKPRIRSASSWWEDNDDGTVTLVILRRVEQSAGVWNHLRFRGKTQAEAEAAYDDYCETKGEESQRRAARRLRWGPVGVSRPR